MKKESFQGILLGVVIMCAVFAFITVAWAAFSSTLKVSGTATVKAQKWDVSFTDSSYRKYNDASFGGVGSSTTGTAVAATDASTKFNITADDTVTGDIGSFSAPKDSISYTWLVTNFGDFAAKLSAVPTPAVTCAAASGSTATTDQVKAVCDHITVSLTDGTGNALSTSTSLVAKSGSNTYGGTQTVKLTVTYDASEELTDSQLPAGDVKVTITEFSLVYTQVTSAS